MLEKVAMVLLLSDGSEDMEGSELMASEKFLRLSSAEVQVWRLPARVWT